MPKITFKNPQGKLSLGPLTVECQKGQSILDIAEDCGARVGHILGGFTNDVNRHAFETVFPVPV